LPQQKKNLLIALGKGKWTNQQLEDAMDTVEKGHTSLKKNSKYWNIPFISFLDHFNGRIKSKKMGHQGVLT